MVFNTIAGLFILAIVCGVGFGVASADSSNDFVRAGTFGLGSQSASSAASDSSSRSADDLQVSNCREQSVLATTSPRTIESGLTMINNREAEQKRQAAIEDAAAIQRVAAGKVKQSAVQEAQAASWQYVEEELADYELPAIDWSVGRKAFVKEWTARIDAYLEGSPLAGCGKVFAEAAWDNGVDPRWSPAISNTESSKGSACFLPYNAWGWGDTGFSDWESAIRAHVAGLASGYGYSITPEAAMKYCPPNSAFWYANTLSQMATI